MNKRLIIIGSGVAGLTSAAVLAKHGHQVTLLEKNKTLGGRARQFSAKGFTFDMGPSWYWMPDVFESFFNYFGKSCADYYQLKRLDPSYRVIFKDEQYEIPAKMDELLNFFEKHEAGSAKWLKKFLADAKYKYEVGMNEFANKPSLSLFEFADPRLIGAAFKLQMFSSIRKEIKKGIKNPKLRQLLEFPVLFLGTSPENIPAMYSLMNYADLTLGTWYPQGGMHQIIKAMKAVCDEQGVIFKTDQEVRSIKVQNGKVHQVITDTDHFETDYVIATADYQHVESQLLEKSYRSYSDKYWDSRVLAPSSLLFYLGVDKKIDNLKHHCLFFDEDYDAHAESIYSNVSWPEKPLFYSCCPSKTDDTVAPEGKENIFLLIPIAPNLEDTPALREKYFSIIIKRLERHSGQAIEKHIIFKKSYCIKEFKEDYHAYKGNAYGLANTLSQTAFLKPRIKSKKVENLFYAGQLTNPGPGLPPAIMSGQIVAKEILKQNN